MMIRFDTALVLFLLLIIFFLIREIYIKAAYKNGDYSEGYRQAINDVAKKYNDLHYKGVNNRLMVEGIHKYLQGKLNGGG
jgi:hypothetical protein